MQCQKCGHTNRANAKFCEACGEKMVTPARAPATPLSSKKAATAGTTCLDCGYANRSGIQYCEECGASLAIPMPEVDPPKRQRESALKLAAVTCPVCGFCNRRDVRFCEECGTELSTRVVPTPQVRRPVRRRKGMPFWLKAVIRFAVSSVSGYVMGKLGMLVLNALFQSLG